MAKTNFLHVEYVFVDSLEALKKIEDQGLNREVCIVSASPAVLMSKNVLNKYQVDMPQPAKFKKFPLLTELFVKEIRSELKDYCRTDSLAGLVTQYTWQFSNVVEKALYLKNDHFTSPVLVISAGKLEEEKFSKVNFPWTCLLKSNHRLVVTNVEDIFVAEQPADRVEKVPLIDRFWLQGFEQYGFKIIQKLHSFAPFLAPRGKILYTRELPLLRSAGFHLGKRFFCLEKISLPQIKTSKQFDLSEQATIVAKLINSAYGEIVPPAVIATLTQNFCTGLERWLSEFTSLVPLWEKVLKNSVQKKRGAILSGLRIAPETAALFAAAERVSIPIYSFQHGPARELCQFNRYSNAYYEGNLSHHFFAWSKVSASVSQSQPFNLAHCTPVGLPKTYRKKALRSPIKNQPKILYASTLLLKGAGGLSALSQASDYHEMKGEKLIIEQVLSQIDSAVLYKKYPHDLRYCDIDPLSDLILKSKNIRLYQGPLELRYFLPFSQLVITSGASSTLAWCIAVNRPVIYLEYKHFRPLAPDVKEILKKCIFYYDLLDPDQIRLLSSFINKPLEEIRIRWTSLQKLRDDFKTNYLGFGKNSEGKICAKKIEENMTV